jgi:hypothetical protein
MAGLVLNALALEPANPIEPGDWTNVAHTRFTLGRGDRAAFTRLRAEGTDLTVLTPERLSRRLTELMFPGYGGSRSLTRAQIDAELAAIDAEPRETLTDIPSVTGEFREAPRASAAVLAQLRQPATARQLRASQAAARAVAAANELLGRDEVDSRAGWRWLTGDVAYTTATLFKRARKVMNDLGGSPIVAGPATGDLAGPATGNDWELPALPGRRNYYDFTTDVLANLAGNGFYKGRKRSSVHVDATQLQRRVLRPGAQYPSTVSWQIQTQGPSIRPYADEGEHDADAPSAGRMEGLSDRRQRRSQAPT